MYGFKTNIPTTFINVERDILFSALFINSMLISTYQI